MTLYTESVADQADHFADVFVPDVLGTSVTLWRRYDIWKFTADTISFREILCKKKMNFYVLAALLVGIR